MDLMPSQEPYGVISTHNPSRVSYKITHQSTSQTRMFEGFRTIALTDLQEEAEKLFSESNLDDCDLIWRDQESDVIPIKTEKDLRVAMKHIGQGQVVKFIFAPKGTDIKGKNPPTSTNILMHYEISQRQ